MIDETQTMHQHTARFGVWAKKARTEAGLSLEELATKAGISKQYLSVIERAAPQNGTNRPVIPSREVVEAIAVALDLAPEVAREVAGYSADAETYDLIDGVQLVFKGMPQITLDQKQRLIDSVRLIAAGVASEGLSEWLRRVPPMSIGREG
jgi:transcriptional regulator with XRE-family HTH domain